MSNCIICEAKIGMLNKPMFGFGKTKDGERICTNCNQKLSKRGTEYCNNISKFSTSEFLNGIKFKKMKEVKEKINQINPKLLKMPEAFELPYLLLEDEIIEKIDQGFLSEGASLLSNGFIVVTDKRVIVLDVNSSPTSLKMSMEEFPLDKITSISFERGIAKSKIKIICSGNATSINILKGGDELSTYIRERINKPQEVKNQKINQDIDSIEQIKKLKELFDTGILNETEFEEKKKNLLNKI